jgi:hypothetical protein
MTLKPVFRSRVGKELLKKYSSLFKNPLETQILTRENINQEIKKHYLERFHGEELSLDPEIVSEEDFFLIFFSTLLGKECEKVEGYAELNYHIRGRIIAADNIIDRQLDSSLPLQKRKTHIGQGVTQLIGSDRFIYDTIRKIGGRKYGQITDKLENRMLGIWDTAENVATDKAILEPREMMRNVHHLIGGELFALGTIAPRILEPEKEEYIDKIESALYDIGTGFQIVDDLADLAEDLSVGSGNLVVSQVYHHGTQEEKDKLKNYMKELDKKGSQLEFAGRENLITKDFTHSATRVLDYAQEKVRNGLTKLFNEGIQIAPKDTEAFTESIAGDLGQREVEKLKRKK